MVRLGQYGLCEGGENCLKYLKRAWNRKEGRETNIFEKGKRGQWLGALTWEDWNYLMNYVIHAFNNILQCIERNTFFAEI